MVVVPIGGGRRERLGGEDARSGLVVVVGENSEREREGLGFMLRMNENQSENLFYIRT